MATKETERLIERYKRDHSPDELTLLRAENERLRDGLQRIKDQNYDAGYSAEDYADAVLTGHEPQQE